MIDDRPEHINPMVPLSSFRIEGTDHLFYANDQEMDILEKAPNITIVNDRRSVPVCICCRMELDPIDDRQADECFDCRVMDCGAAY